MLYECPEGHKFGVGGWGEDLTAGITRHARREQCPLCCRKPADPPPPPPT